MNSFHALTVGVITKNAGEDLPGLLESLPPEVELVVADGGSEDATVDLARAAAAIVIEQDQEAIRRAGGNFDVARNGISRVASRDWILFLDADERLTIECREEISAVLAERPNNAAYDIPRVNLYWGRSVRLLGDDRQLRLVRRHKGRYFGERLHQRMQVDGRVGHLRHPILHVNARSWRDLVRRLGFSPNLCTISDSTTWRTRRGVTECPDWW
jgi:(heptosyl)LPS beta-1,4-glucosyltransferase